MVDFLLGFRCSVRNDPRAAQIPIIIPYITPAKITMPKDAKQNKPRCVLLEKKTLAFLATIVSKKYQFSHTIEGKDQFTTDSVEQLGAEGNDGVY